MCEHCRATGLDGDAMAAASMPPAVERLRNLYGLFILTRGDVPGSASERATTHFFVGLCTALELAVKDPELAATLERQIRASKGEIIATPARLTDAVLTAIRADAGLPPR